jgi:hypothetical protein
MKFIHIVIFVILSLTSFAQQHENKCDLMVEKAYTQNTFGKIVGYYVDFKNNGTKPVDGIKWTARFYDNFGELKGKEEGQWQSGNFIDPIVTGKTASDLEAVWIDEATKVFITIDLVHFTDGESCKHEEKKKKK